MKLKDKMLKLVLGVALLVGTLGGASLYEANSDLKEENAELEQLKKEVESNKQNLEIQLQEQTKTIEDTNNSINEKDNKINELEIKLQEEQKKLEEKEKALQDALAAKEAKRKAEAIAKAEAEKKQKQASQVAKSNNTSNTQSGSKSETVVVSRGASSSSTAVSGVQREFYVSATAYTPWCAGCSGITATGINVAANPNMKVIAVDPKVIPLGSKVWVEGYGYAIAADTGGAIKGNKIDVLMPDTGSAKAWGRKQVLIKVLGK